MGKRHKETFVLVTAVAVRRLEFKDYKKYSRHELYLILEGTLEKKQAGLWDSSSRCYLGLNTPECINAEQITSVGI